jgi:hypothetical protein
MPKKISLNLSYNDLNKMSLTLSFYERSELYNGGDING